jgi:hypothetical protein
MRSMTFSVTVIEIRSVKLTEYHYVTYIHILHYTLYIIYIYYKCRYIHTNIRVYAMHRPRACKHRQDIDI